MGVPINPAWKSRLQAHGVNVAGIGRTNVYDLVMRRLAQMSRTPVGFDPFTGPIRDRKGVLRVPEGKVMTVGELTSMEWAAPGIVGAWPREP
jgi:simple sugar transport system substrate-binding protein